MKDTIIIRELYGVEKGRDGDAIVDGEKERERMLVKFRATNYLRMRVDTGARHQR